MKTTSHQPQNQSSSSSSPQAPPLEWSSDSGSDGSYVDYVDDDDDDDIVVEREGTLAAVRETAGEDDTVTAGLRSLLDRSEGENDDDDEDAPRRHGHRGNAHHTALLRTVAAVHLPPADHLDAANARTCVSAPGRRSTTLRARARARLQQRRGHTMAAARNEDEVAPTPPLLRSSREDARRGRRDGVPAPQSRDARVRIASSAAEEPSTAPAAANRIRLHVYDLIEKDTLMLLPPFGCVVEIGKCFADMNTALHAVGTGAYHVGVEIDGVEYAYGATTVRDRTGVFTCFPRLSPGYQYRTTIDLGERPLLRRSWVSVPSEDDAQLTVYREVEESVPGRTVMKEMATEYMGSDYDILRKNCCTFARDACLRLGVPDEEIPSWFGNLAESGAFTQDAVRTTVMEPLTTVLSLACEDNNHSNVTQRRSLETAVDATEEGFETVFQTSDHSRVLVVVEEEHDHARDLRRNSTWAY